MENKIPIGLTIKRIIDQKNLSITDIAGQLEVSRANVYNVFGRDKLKKSDLEKWAKALDVSVSDLQSNLMYSQTNTPNQENFENDTLETIKKLIEEELKEKNEQIRSLQSSLKYMQESLRESQRLASALLGKSHEYSSRPVVPPKKEIPMTVLGNFR